MAIYNVVGAKGMDWEDMAIGPGPSTGEDYLNLGDIGDNAESRPSVTIYRIPQATAAVGGGSEEFDLSGAVALRMRYHEGAQNPEALLADPDTADLYIVTKDGTSGLSKVFRYPFPHAEGSMVTSRPWHHARQ